MNRLAHLLALVAERVLAYPADPWPTHSGRVVTAVATRPGTSHSP